MNISLSCPGSSFSLLPAEPKVCDLPLGRICHSLLPSHWFSSSRVRVWGGENRKNSSDFPLLGVACPALATLHCAGGCRMAPVQGPACATSSGSLADLRAHPQFWAQWSCPSRPALLTLQAACLVSVPALWFRPTQQPRHPLGSPENPCIPVPSNAGSAGGCHSCPLSSPGRHGGLLLLGPVPPKHSEELPSGHLWEVSAAGYIPSLGVSSLFSGSLQCP